MANTNWTQSELDILRDIFPKYGTKRVAKTLNRKIHAVQKKAQRLGIKKDKYYRIREHVAKIPQFKSKDKLFESFICGFVSGEGSFIICQQAGREKSRFIFSIGLADDDCNILHKIRDYLGIGAVREYPARRKSWKGECIYRVENMGELLRVIIPLFDSVDFYYSRKGYQYKKWRSELMKISNML